MQLRPYQEDTVNEAREIMRQGIKSILIQAPTGSGKTVLTAFMLKSAQQKNFSSIFIVHRRELIKQSIDTFNNVGLPHGVISAGFPENPRALVQVASVQTLARRLKYLKKPRLIVWDECHHCAAGSWSKVHEMFSDAYHIGLSATPCRLDGKGLGKYFQEMINGPSVKWLIDNKFLSDYRIYIPSTINVSGIHKQMGDYNKEELNAAADKPSITGNAINEYKRHADGKRAVVFCVSIEHSKHVVDEFNKQGVPASHIDGAMNPDLRDYTIERFRDGKIKILSNVDLIGEGFDLPSIEVAILLRPTQSCGLYLQQVGRALRIAEGKSSAIILDHAGNTMSHGLPDEERKWGLDGYQRQRSESEPKVSIRVCPKCYAAVRAFLKSCNYCGHAFEIKGREVEQKDGDLKEIDKEMLRRQKVVEQGRAQTEEELVQVGIKRGYKRPRLWARWVLQARQKKKMGGALV